MKGIEKRKDDHIRISIENEVGLSEDYWADVRLVHEAIPEVDFDDIDCSTVFLGRKLSCPLIVTAITGGFSKAEEINKNLAIACANVGVGLGVGSQRAALEGGDDRSYAVIKEYDVPLKIGNIGAPQLIKQKEKRALTKEDAEKAIAMIDADVLAIHLNFLQEMAQPEGDISSVGCYDAIRSLAKELPIIVKETGAGISRATALRLKGIGIRALDVSGTGGTSFSKVESFRSERMADNESAEVGKTFGDWGIPAPLSVIAANVGIPLIASGGVMNGLHAAKGIALGAKCSGLARAVLADALKSPEAVEKHLQLMIREFKTAMFLTGSKNIKEFSAKKVILTGAVREWASQMEG
ncbi:type 2 isopentenyl-diphosphate Delta-isomerase [Candidatus Methanomassiliicoccus intestinalis]|uniref:type 2 isopentenyl-diphosphate Delta-isomerase n=1 Tax=Candidatus Methanomassiliicoccus intestinalis TaxID=1406512 RepID=UPI0037DC18BD